MNKRTCMLLAGLSLLGGCGQPSPEKVCSHAAELSKQVDENDCKSEFSRLQAQKPEMYEKRAKCVLDAKNDLTVVNCIRREASKLDPDAAKLITEAKNAVATIALSAMRAHERDDKVAGDSAQPRVMCRSAISVPGSIPSQAYAASAKDGEDFNTGDATTGWRCLKFSAPSPLRCQYTYRVGGDYKSPKRGGADPGPNGFEAAAECNFGGSSRTKLFARTGHLDPSTDILQVSTQTFISDDGE